MRGEVGEEDMFATIIGDRVYLRLSRRNLRQLDAILDDPAFRDRCLTRKAENGVSLVVQVEDDEDHYEGHNPGQRIARSRNSTGIDVLERSSFRGGSGLGDRPRSGWSTVCPAQLRPEPDAIKLAPRELIDRLRADPIDYFRFVNRPWIARVCEVFAEDMPDLPIVRLHGDAHLEQFAVTKDAWGLDDFDDSARGPALIDMVRFLGSIDLTLRRRGWIGDREALFDRFFAGYRRGLAEPDY